MEKIGGCQRRGIAAEMSRQSSSGFEGIENAVNDILMMNMSLHICLSQRMYKTKNDT